MKMGDEKKASEHINLKVLGQDNTIVQFKIKKHTHLKKLMMAYCEKVGFSMATVRFRFDGQAINEYDTPDVLEMEDGDTIEVYQQQTGGGWELSHNLSCVAMCSDNNLFLYCFSMKRQFCSPPWTLLVL